MSKISLIESLLYFNYRRDIISSNPSGVDLYLSDEKSTKESYLGKTPTKVSLVSEKLFQWKIRAVHKDYEPLEWFVHGGINIDHHFAFIDTGQTRLPLFILQEKFKPYGFDVIEFLAFARNNLKTRGEINFGNISPEIDFRDFKGHNYVEVKINYLVTYNTLRVSMYDAASMTFDEIVKKLAKKIATDFKKQDEIEGFIFNVTYTNKDFLQKYDVPSIVINEFILPKDACRKYADLDITNQDLINQSIVLVDGERVALNLQHSK